ncbi:MAG: amidohydrolase [Candidatus Kapabacteria bacterium]|nr:amidohydrolase [Candidatus Kapabacteria bacterium]MCS7169135.1 amidohydrolase [Candidatus Kapabacteria bacterium]MDW7996468.1 amidohydrolase family protein [Bacteroidota bacterium]MDW8225512.1 amidohydrolase family protein [Bacteroidota bacterium]
MGLRKIDIHAHILPVEWPDLKRRFGYGGFIRLEHYAPGRARMVRDDGTFFREVRENAWNPERILEDMDRHGVSVMVLSTVPVLFSYWARPQDCYEWSQFLNDHLAEVVARHSGRFLALGTVPLQDPDYAIRELERCVCQLGFPGVEIGSNVGGRNLDSPELFPFYEAVQEFGAALFVHPWDMLGQERLQNYFLEWLVGMPAETTLAICSFIFGGVFDHFPRIRVLFAHGGGSFAFTLGRIARGYEVRPDLCNVHAVQNPRLYTGRFWVDTVTHDPRALRFLLETFGPERVVYGTDYPFPLGDLEHGRIIDELGLEPEVAERVFVGNALQFLGLTVAEPGTVFSRQR